jgi:hypothetical protein
LADLLIVKAEVTLVVILLSVVRILTSETPCSLTMAFLHVQLLNLIVEVMAGCGLRLGAVAVLSGLLCCSLRA